MEKLQAIVSLRAAGYNQAVLRTRFSEPDGWMAHRIRQHQAIRDDLLQIFRSGGLETRTPHAGRYLFPSLPNPRVRLHDLVRLIRYIQNVAVSPGNVIGRHYNSRRLNIIQQY